MWNRKVVIVPAAWMLVAGGLFACVGDDPTTGDDSVADASPTSNDATNGTDAQTASDTGTTIITDAGAEAQSDAASSACESYCASQVADCVGTDPPDIYPDIPTCLAFCATFSPTGFTANSIQCRLGFLADADCPASGPWGADNQTSSFCGASTCTKVCALAAPKCAAADASLGTDCETKCNTILTGAPTATTTCLETETLDMFGDAGPNAIVTACKAWQKCGN